MYLSVLCGNDYSRDLTIEQFLNNQTRIKREQKLSDHEAFVSECFYACLAELRCAAVMSCPTAEGLIDLDVTC